MLSVGSNLGDRLGTLQGCVQAIGGLADTDVLAISPVYETAPVGGPAQPDYLNAVLVVGTALGPRALLAATQGIEADFGRVRRPGAERFGPRTLDIDIISYDEEVSDDPVLTLPHPRAHERAFVLAPWHDLDPRAALPGRGPVAALLAAAAAPAMTASGGGPTWSWIRREADPRLDARRDRRGLRGAGLAAAPRAVRQAAPAALDGRARPADRRAGRGVDRPRPEGADRRPPGSGQGAGRDLKPAAPLFVSRMVALAKASSLAAAIIAGFAAGFDVYLSGSLSASVPRQDALTAVITFAAAVVLACAALYLENCCRVPEDPDRDERDAPATSR